MGTESRSAEANAAVRATLEGLSNVLNGVLGPAGGADVLGPRAKQPLGPNTITPPVDGAGNFGSTAQNHLHLEELRKRRNLAREKGHDVSEYDREIKKYNDLLHGTPSVPAVTAPPSPPTPATPPSLPSTPTVPPAVRAAADYGLGQMHMMMQTVKATATAAAGSVTAAGTAVAGDAGTKIVGGLIAIATTVGVTSIRAEAQQRKAVPDMKPYFTYLTHWVLWAVKEMRRNGWKTSTIRPPRYYRDWLKTATP